MLTIEYKPIDNDLLNSNFDSGIISDNIDDIQNGLRNRKDLVDDRIESLPINDLDTADRELTRVFGVDLKSSYDYNGLCYHYVGNPNSKGLLKLLNMKKGEVYLCKPFCSNILDDSLFVVTKPVGGGEISSNLSWISDYISFLHCVYAMNNWMLDMVETNNYVSIAEYLYLIVQ